MEKMVRAAQEPKEKLFLACTMFLGMRESEIAHMKEEWIRYQANKILIPQKQACECSECRNKKDKEGNSRYDGFWYPKSKAGARGIPLWHPYPKEVIKSWFAIYKDVPYTRKTVYNVLVNLAERARVQKRVYPHALRATAATHYAEMGLSAQGLCEVMGWGDLRTDQHYIRRLGKTAERELSEKAK